MSIVFDDPIAETLLIPLYMRALQSQRVNPIIADPWAVELVRQIDYDFSKFDNKPASEIGTALRIRHFDDKCMAFLQDNTVGVIVNVGADWILVVKDCVPKPLIYWQKRHFLV